MSTDPKKDVIYVDIEDDITSVIEKVKNASMPIVALVPPKRIGVLQSSVNLRLLQRAAQTAKKRVVLITNDQALTGLAAGVAMPVAKNLQSRPALPSVAAVSSSDDDVINGDQLPVGELAKTADQPIEIDAPPVATEPGAAAASAPFAAKAAAKAPKKGSRIPNFDSFRKKMFIFGGAGALLLIFLVWAIFFAGKATVAITAKTNIVNINQPLQLREGAKLDAGQAVAPVIVKEMKKSATVDFSATGKKEVGEKASGSVKFTNDSLSSVSIPAGTPLQSSSGLVFKTTNDVSVPGASLGNCNGKACVINGSASGPIQAAQSGSRYNGATGSMNGAPEDVSATLNEATSGGTDKTVTVVSQNDIDKAKEKLQAQDSNKLKSELKKEFSENAVVIDESFSVEPADPTSSPGLNQEASSAKLTAETTYRLIGLTRSDLRAIFDAYTKTQIAGEKNQKIYESGDEAVKFTEFSAADKGYTVRSQATAQVGPNIDDKALATQLVGMRSGEIQQKIETIQGVEDVSVKLSPFWVTKAPSNAKKIDIKFVVNHDQN